MNSIHVAMTTLVSLALVLPAQAEIHEPGATIDDAAMADVTPDGFSALGGLVGAILPEQLEVGDQTGTESLLCDLNYAIYDMWISMALPTDRTAIQVTPGNGYLDIALDFDVWVNDASDPFQMFMEVDCSWFSFDDTCYGHIDPFSAKLDMRLYLEVVDDGFGNTSLDATIDSFSINYDDLQGEDITLEDCSIGTLEEWLGYIGLSLYDYIIDLASGYLDSSVEDMLPDIETTIEDAFASASIDEEIDLLGTTLRIELQPSDIIIQPSGMRLVMEGSMNAGEQALCIADVDPGGSLATTATAPEIGAAPTGIWPDFHAALLLSDDIANQALYALWRSGLLCFSLDESFSSFDMDTSLLTMLGTDAFDELFPEPAPLIIETRPESVPQVEYLGAHDIDVDLQELGLDFYGELDSRQALLVGLDVDGPLGVDVGWDSGTGEVGASIDVSALDLSVRSCEIVPEARVEIEEALPDLIGTIMDTFLGDQLSALSTVLPTYEGVGVTDIDMASASSDGNWLGAYTKLGEVSYEGSDCSSSGTTCSATGSARFRWNLLAFAAMFLLVRRRS